MPRHTPLPEDLRPRAFAVSEALALGVSASRMRGRDLRRPFHGIRSHEDVATVQSRCEALQTVLRPGQFFSHATAALLHGFPVPLRVHRDPQLHVSAVRPRSPPRRQGVVGHRVAGVASPAALVDGLSVAPPVLVWCTLATTLGVPDLVAVADHLVSGSTPMATIPDIARAAESWRGRPGAGRLAAAIPHIRVSVRSRQETLARLAIAAAGLPEPELNASIFSPSGAFLAMPDFLWRAARIGAEYEGDHHRSDQRQFRHDITRRERVEDHHWRLLRFTTYDVRFGTAEFVERIAARLGVTLDAGAVGRAVRLARSFEA